MFNGNKINQLLKSRGYTAKDLLEHLGVKDNGTISRFTGRDIKASRLEQIADFFSVSVDYFFDRVEGDCNIAQEGAVATSGGHAESHIENNNGHTKEMSSRIRNMHAQIASLKSTMIDKERIIREQEERIKLLEKLLMSYETK